MQLFTDSMNQATLLLVLRGKRFRLGDTYPLIACLRVRR